MGEYSKTPCEHCLGGMTSSCVFLFPFFEIHIFFLSPKAPAR